MKKGGNACGFKKTRLNLTLTVCKIAFLDSKAWLCTKPYSNEYKRLRVKK